VVVMVTAAPAMDDGIEVMTADAVVLVATVVVMVV
jgi:hypothetical protein